MFDCYGDFIHDHDLEAGAWDGHSYDCDFPAAVCSCDPEAGLAWLEDTEDDVDYDDAAFEDCIDYAAYIGSR